MFNKDCSVVVTFSAAVDITELVALAAVLTALDVAFITVVAMLAVVSATEDTAVVITSEVALIVFDV